MGGFCGWCLSPGLGDSFLPPPWNSCRGPEAVGHRPRVLVVFTPPQFSFWWCRLRQNAQDLSVKWWVFTFLWPPAEQEWSLSSAVCLHSMEACRGGVLKLHGHRTLHLLTVLPPRVFSVFLAPTSINAQMSNKKTVNGSSFLCKTIYTLHRRSGDSIFLRPTPAV